MARAPHLNLPRRLAVLAGLATAAAAAAASAAAFCGTCANGGPPPMADTQLSLACSDAGSVVSAVSFASYGTPTGACGSWALGACNAANSTAVVEAACLGRQSCVVWPNTTTFGDPCFGTPKQLAVQLACSAGGGTAACGTPPPPAPALHNFSASVVVDWATPAGSLRVEPSIQVVSQHLLMRGSPIHDAAFATLAQLGARHVRFVPWIPYPRAGVAELEPPSAPHLCGRASWTFGQVQPVVLDCGAGGGVIDKVEFASFGQPTGACGAYADGPCTAANSSAVVEAACLGQPRCSLPTAPGANAFGAPCGGSAATWLAVQVTCSVARSFAYWDFSQLDALMLDFWQAVDGDASQPIPNFSTQPSWLYDALHYTYPEDATRPWYGYDRGTAPAANSSALGDYYGRLYAWYMRGGFVDEAGVTHTSGHALNVSLIEVYNEPDYEHGHTAEVRFGHTT